MLNKYSNATQALIVEEIWLVEVILFLLLFILISICSRYYVIYAGKEFEDLFVVL